jgi:quercetin 2,3-dioxygenase
MENFITHKANTRGTADHGWLKANFSFSFANYFNADRMHFGVLRVMNDDIIAAGMGFGTHPHENMEIITIPLSGALEHKDSMGNGKIINYGDIQCMSAGTGIEHSEFNPDKNNAANTLQIWMFPNKQNVTPRYDQLTLDKTKSINNLQQILSPNSDDEGVWVHQDAWFHQGVFEKDFSTSYQIKRKENGVYVFVINGDVTINGQALNKRDGIGVWNTDQLSITANSNDTEILVMDIPLTLPQYE